MEWHKDAIYRVTTQQEGRGSSLKVAEWWQLLGKIKPSGVYALMCRDASKLVTLDFFPYAFLYFLIFLQ
jgi:hypothetical protein